MADWTIILVAVILFLFDFIFEEVYSYRKKYEYSEVLLQQMPLLIVSEIVCICHNQWVKIDIIDAIISTNYGQCFLSSLSVLMESLLWSRITFRIYFT